MWRTWALALIEAVGGGDDEVDLAYEAPEEGQRLSCDEKRVIVGKFRAVGGMTWVAQLRTAWHEATGAVFPQWAEKRLEGIAKPTAKRKGPIVELLIAALDAY